MFETYRENFQEKYWLPTYTSSDEYTGSGDDQLHLRLVVRSTDFKLNAPATAASSEKPADTSTPTSPR
jgi:hypothetical protein